MTIKKRITKIKAPFPAGLKGFEALPRITAESVP
jgi:hypothetical protein